MLSHSQEPPATNVFPSDPVHMAGTQASLGSASSPTRSPNKKSVPPTMPGENVIQLQYECTQMQLDSQSQSQGLAGGLLGPSPSELAAQSQPIGTSQTVLDSQPALPGTLETIGTSTAEVTEIVEEVTEVLAEDIDVRLEVDPSPDGPTHPPWNPCPVENVVEPAIVQATRVEMEETQVPVEEIVPATPENVQGPPSPAHKTPARESTSPTPVSKSAKSTMSAQSAKSAKSAKSVKRGKKAKRASLPVNRTVAALYDDLHPKNVGARKRKVISYQESSDSDSATRKKTRAEDFVGEPTQAARQCGHCAVGMSTVWREGPSGTTLCADCGGQWSLHATLDGFVPRWKRANENADLREREGGKGGGKYAVDEAVYALFRTRDTSTYYAATVSAVLTETQYRIVYYDGHARICDDAFIRPRLLRVDDLVLVKLDAAALRGTVVSVGEEIEVKVGGDVVKKGWSDVYFTEDMAKSNDARMLPAKPREIVEKRVEKLKSKQADKPSKVRRVEAQPSSSPAKPRDGLFSGYTFVTTSCPDEVSCACTPASPAVSVPSCGATVETTLRPGVVLLAAKPVKTRKYFLALAMGLEIVSATWLRDSMKEGRVCNVEFYRLPTGFSREIGSYICPPRRVGVFEGSKVLIHAGLKDDESGFKALWEPVLKAAGATVLPTTRAIQSQECDFVLCESYPDAFLKNGLHGMEARCVTKEFVIECLVNQRIVAKEAYLSKK